MIDLYNSSITDILPTYLADQTEVKAVGYAIHMAVSRLLTYCRGTSVYTIIDTAPDSVLDMLALELGTQYYEDTLGIEAKRKLIKNTLIWYMTAGTPSAVEELTQAVFGEGEVLEWFDYGDDPYYFKIKTNAKLTPTMNEQFSSMLEKVKNARSHIRAIEIHRTLHQVIYSSALAQPNYKPAAIIDGYSVGREADQIIHGAVSEYALTHPEAVIDGFKVAGDEVEANIVSSIVGGTTAKQAAIREALSFSADTVQQESTAGAAQISHAKAAVIREGLSFESEDIQSTITAGVAADNGIYKNTITE